MEHNNHNNHGVPNSVHIITTILVLIVFSFSLEQACSLSIQHNLFKIRIGVLLSNAILSVLSIVLNFDLLRINGDINFLDSDFVLIVRTLQILWLFIAFFIGYFFVTYSIDSAYKSSNRYINNEKENIINKKNNNNNNNNNDDHININIITPSWIRKFWLICTIFMEITLFLCYIIAFTTTDIFYIHICWISSFTFSIIAALLVIFALIDIRKYVYNKTKQRILSLYKNNNNNNNNNSHKKLEKLNRLLVTMIILCIIMIIASIINLVIMIRHIIDLDESKNLFRESTLSSTAIDNVEDYISYFLILLCVEISFVFWTFKPNSINYCLFICCYNNDNNDDDDIKVNKDTICYAFCRTCIDNAVNHKRRRIRIRKQQQDKPKVNNDNNNNNVQRQSTVTTTEQQQQQQQQQQQHERINSSNNISITNMVQQSINIQNNIIENDQSITTKIKIILYDFDGVLTNKKHRYFEHWTQIDVEALTKEHLNTIFGSDQRINYLYQHFNFLISNNIKIFCISNENSSKIWTIFKKLNFENVFNKECIISCNSSKITLFILDLIKKEEIDNDQLLYISANHENIRHFLNINLCTTYQINSNYGILSNNDDHDIINIQNLV